VDDIMVLMDGGSLHRGESNLDLSARERPPRPADACV